MKRKIIVWMFGFCLMALLVFALDFRPKANVDMQGRYNLTNFTDITSNISCSTDFGVTSFVDGVQCEYKGNWDGYNLNAKNNNITLDNLNGYRIINASDSIDLVNAISDMQSDYNSILLPCGEYSISSSINLSLSGTKIQGSGKDCTILRASTSWDSATDPYMIRISNDSVVLRDIQLNGMSSGVQRLLGGIILTGDTGQSSEALVENVQISNYNNTGIMFENDTYYSTISHVSFYQTNDVNESACIHLGYHANENTIFSSRIGYCDYGIVVDNSDHNKIIANSIEGDTAYLNNIGIKINGTDSELNEVAFNRFEARDTSINIDSASTQYPRLFGNNYGTSTPVATAGDYIYSGNNRHAMFSQDTKVGTLQVDETINFTYGDAVINGSIITVDELDSPSNYDVSDESLYYAYNFNSMMVDGTEVKDATKQELNMSVVGATRTSTEGFNGGGAYYMDGVNDYLNMTTAVDLGDEYSISLWVNVYNFTNNAVILGLSDWDDVKLITRYTGNKGFTFYSATDGNNLRVDSIDSTYTTDVWYHIVVTQSQTTHNLSYYLNGVLKIGDYDAGSTTVKWGNSYGASLIGSQLYQNANPEKFFNGTIDDIRMYTRVLTSDEVSSLYHGRKEVQSSRWW